MREPTHSPNEMVIFNNYLQTCINYELIIGSGITELSRQMLPRSRDKLIAVTLPEGLLDIGIHTFYNCYNLQSIIIPGSVTQIGESAFKGCTNLANIKLEFPPANGEMVIGQNAFKDCSQNMTLTFSGENGEGGGIYISGRLSRTDGAFTVNAPSFDPCIQDQFSYPFGWWNIREGGTIDHVVFT